MKKESNVLQGFHSVIVEQLRCWITTSVLIITCALSAIGQSYFSTTISGHNRGYLLTASGAESPNLPLVIILHPNSSNAEETFHSVPSWKNLSQTAIVVFPLSGIAPWSCYDSIRTNEDQEFLSVIIDQVYSNYHVDRNRAYIVAAGEGYCLALDYHRNHPSKVTQVLEHAVEEDKNSISAIDRLLQTMPDNSVKHQLWKKIPLDSIEDKKMRIDSIKATRWAGRTTISVKAWRFMMLSTVNTGIDDKTYMDISDVKNLYTLELTKWMNDSMAWFVDIGWLKIPTKQEVSFKSNGINSTIKGEGGGGAIVPISVGFKYAIHRSAFRPYFELSTGPMMVTVIGGKFRASTTNMDPSSIRSDIENEARLAMHFTLGAGYEWRMGSRVYHTAQLKYIHSSQFDSVGQVNAIKGFSIGFGIGYIMGINKNLGAQ